MKSPKKIQTLKFFLQFISITILMSAAFLKLSKAEESFYIFSQLGMEPHGRILIALLEILSIFFLSTKNYAQHGAFLAFGIVMGAFIAHVSVLGLELNNDGGFRFYFLIILALSLSGIMYIERKKLPFIGKVLSPIQTQRKSRSNRSLD